MYACKLQVQEEIVLSKSKDTHALAYIERERHLVRALWAKEQMRDRLSFQRAKIHVHLHAYIHTKKESQRDLW
jgi:hypothetical protein